MAAPAFEVSVTEEGLARHLHRSYGIDVSAVRALDVAVWRIEPAEPLSPGRSAALLGALLGRLHAAEVSPAFLHPDFVSANAIPTPDEKLVVVDWTGAGRGPRLPSLGLLLWAVGARSPKLLELVASRYRRSVTLKPTELERLAGAIALRPLTLECWSFCAGRRSLEDAVARAEEAVRLAKRIAGQAVELLTTSASARVSGDRGSARGAGGPEAGATAPCRADSGRTRLREVRLRRWSAGHGVHTAGSA